MPNGEQWLKNHRETGLWDAPGAQANWGARVPQWSFFQQIGAQEGWRIPVHYFGSSIAPACDAWVDAVALGPIDRPAQVPPVEPSWTSPPGGGGKWLMNF